MASLLTEKFVQDSIIEYLFRKGWSKNLRSKTEKEHGVDIKVRNNKFPRYWVIEVKGNASSKALFPNSHREVNFNLALGQIMTRMKTSGARSYKYRYKYGVGYPSNFRDLVIRRIPYDVCDKLNLFIFLVNEEGKIELLDWKKLKNLQKK